MVDQAIALSDPTVFVCKFSPIRQTSLDQHPVLIAGQECYHRAAFTLGNLPWEYCRKSTTAVLGALVDISQQLTYFGWGRLIVWIGLSELISS